MGGRVNQNVGADSSPKSKNPAMLVGESAPARRVAGATDRPRSESAVAPDLGNSAKSFGNFLT